MVDIALDDLKDLYEQWIERRLGDDAPPELFSRAISTDVSGPASGFNFLFAGAAVLDASLFNSPGDTDIDAVLGSMPAADADTTSFDWRPQIHIADTFAWLKYRALADIRLDADGKLAGSVFGMNANASVRVASYHRHGADDRIVAAVTDDLKALRTPFTVAEVLDLEVGDATMVSAAGQLEARVELAWSDILVSGASRLARLLDAGEMLGIELKSTATVGFDLRLSDDFKLVFTRRDAGTIRVAVLKKAVSSQALTASAGVDVRFADPDAIDRLLREGLASMTGVSLRRIDSLIDKLGQVDNLDALSPLQRDIAEKLMDKLGLDAVLGKVEALRDRLVELKADVKKTIADIAMTRVRIGFEYEYARIATDAALLEADLSTAALKRHHRDLLGLKLVPLLGGGSGIDLVRFLHETTTIRRSAYGFALGINKWRLSSDVEREQRFVRQRAESGGLKVALLGSYAYSDEDTLVEKAGRKWSAEFTAQTNGFSDNALPGIDEFEFGLDLSFGFDERRTSREEYARLVDLAQLWGILPRGDATEQVDDIQAVAGNGRTQVHIGLTLDNATVRAFASFVTALTESTIARALAGALAWHGDYVGRSDLALRTQLYAPLWVSLHRERSLINRPRVIGLTAHRHLKVNGHRKLANRERDTDHLRRYTLAAVAMRQPRFWHDFDQMTGAFGELAVGLSQRRPYTGLTGISTGIQRFCTNEIYLRAFGALIESFRDTRSAPPNGINAGMNIAYRADGKDMSLTLAASRTV